MKIIFHIILSIIFLQHTVASDIPVYSLGGDLEINITEKSIETDFIITNFEEEKKDSLLFILNDIFEIKSMSINDESVEFDISNENCFDCNYYNVPIKKTNKHDKLRISAIGYFSNEKNKGKVDYKGLISYKEGILRASEQAKWYPVIIEDKRTPSFAVKTMYNYDLNVLCPECKNIFVGDGMPKQKEGTFKSTTPQNSILLIAGNYDFTATDNGIYLNLSDSEVNVLESNIESILDYYGQISGIRITKKIVYAHLPSDNKKWGGFVSFPVIVDVNKKAQIRRLHYISHELAHFYFGDIYIPKSNLFWFYLESFAEYFSYKYLLNNNAASIVRDYERLKKIRMAQRIPFFKSIKGYNFRFVKLKKVEDISDVTGIHRYSIGGFQLLGIDKEIGEEKMKLLIREVFQHLDENEHGYTTLINALKKIGIDESIISMIEKKYFKKLKYREYKFIKEKIKSSNHSAI